MTETLDTVVDQLFGNDIGFMVDAAIDAEYRELSRISDRIECRRALLLTAIHHRGIPTGDGAASTPSWVQAQTGQSRRDANASLQTGLACETLPLMAKAWAQAEISTSAAREIGAGIPEGHEASYTAIEATLVDFAAAHDWRGLRAAIAYCRRCADAIDDREPTELNGLHHSQVGDRWATRGDFDDLGGTTIDTALNAAIGKPIAGDDRTPSKRRADALVEICRFYLDHGDLPIEGGESPHLSVVLTHETLAGRLPSSTGIGPSLSAAQIAELLCDSKISRIITGPASQPLDVGREYRTAPRWLRRAIAFRDKGCRFPGCDRKPHKCKVHHVIWWENGGETIVINVILLCQYHHGIVHKPGWSNTFDGITYTVTKPNGETFST